MPPQTREQMRDARDAEDARLLEAREHETLVATYLDTIVGRCRARVYGPEAEDVVQNVLLRLWSELQRGRRYAVPYRVVVHQVIDWKLKEHFTGLEHHGEIDELEGPGGELDATLLDLEAVIARMPDSQRQVAHLRFLLGLEPAQIAEVLGKEPNAVHQALHNAKGKLREWLA